MSPRGGHVTYTSLVLVLLGLVALIRCTPARASWPHDAKRHTRSLDRRSDVVQVYHLIEESPEGTFVADFGASLSQSSSVGGRHAGPEALALRRRFQLIPIPPPRRQGLVSISSATLESVFYLDSQTGSLTTFARVDREQLCGRDDDSTSDETEADAEACTLQFGVRVVPDDVTFFVKVVIDDINDNDPTFPDAVVHVRLSETATKGTQIALAAARDGDSGQNGTLSYELFPPEVRREFDLHAMSPFVFLTLKSAALLDRETVDRKSLILTAIDGGHPRRTGSVVVEIEIADSNDNGPKFDKQKYTLHVAENQPVGTIVGRVVATDDDVGDNARISYSIESSRSRASAASTELFAMDTSTGDVILSSAIDYERRTRYHLHVRATDGGSPSLTGYAEVVVVVVDVNDNSPEILFEPSGSTKHGNGSDVVVTVAEDVPVGSTIARFSVYDADTGSGGSIDHCRVQQDDRAAVDGQLIPFPFSLKTSAISSPAEFALVTDVELDRESVDFYSVSVVCVDGGDGRVSGTGGGNRSLIGRARVTVHVTDVNDNAPIFASFDGAMFVRLKENNEPEAMVARLVATDADLGDNASVSYSIGATVGVRDLNGRSANCSDVLRVDRLTGVVRATASFDREWFHQISCVVIARDAGQPPQTTSGLMIVDVEDANDETPQFRQELYEFDVAENQPVGTEVGRLVAIDADLPPFNRVQYFVDSESSSSSAVPFNVDVDRGTLLMTRRLDREAGNTTFRLTIFALDASAGDDGPPTTTRKTGSATVVVTVTDVNDNRPTILFPPPPTRVGRNDNLYEFLINTQPPVVVAGGNGMGDDVIVVGSVIAVDDDVGSNARLTYDLISSDPVREYGLFRINETSGEILASRRELLRIHSSSSTTTKSYRMRARVVDGGLPRLMAETEFYVVVNRTDDVTDDVTTRPSSWQDYFGVSTSSSTIVTISLAVSLVVVVLALVSCCLPVRWRRPLKYTLEVARDGSVTYRPKGDEVRLPELVDSPVTSSKTLPDVTSGSQYEVDFDVEKSIDGETSLVINSLSGDQPWQCYSNSCPNSTSHTAAENETFACRCVSVCCDCCSCQPSATESRAASRQMTTAVDMKVPERTIGYDVTAEVDRATVECDTRAGSAAAAAAGRGAFDSLPGYLPMMYDQCTLKWRHLAESAAVNDPYCSNCSVAAIQQESDALSAILPPKMSPVHWTCRSTDLFRKRYQLPVPDGGSSFSRPLLMNRMLSADGEPVVESPPHHVTPGCLLDYKHWTSRTMNRTWESVEGDRSADPSRRVLATSPFRRPRDWVDSCPTCAGGSLASRRTVHHQNVDVRPNTDATGTIPRRYGTAAGYNVRGDV